MAKRPYKQKKPKFDPKSLGTTVIVEYDNIEKALRLFKRKCADAGTVLECRERQAYTKPTEKRKKMKAAAKQRTKREMAKNKIHKKRLY
jgi:small subunit ribosomal protein S21|tara:strand:+ start:1239 stop:1505 length:267 start_codon:yes stop_codon:yes gene_type:complete